MSDIDRLIEGLCILRELQLLRNPTVVAHHSESICVELGRRLERTEITRMRLEYLGWKNEHSPTEWSWE